jgi:transcription elongation factor GreA
MSPNLVYLTPEGKAKLEAELEHLRSVRRREVAERIHLAMEFAGDPIDNTEYQDAKNEQSFVEGRILELERTLADVRLIEHKPGDSDLVHLGSEVTVVYQDGEQDTFTIVGSAEAAPLEGRISNESPVGRALLGHRVGDKVQVKTPGGDLSLTIIECDQVTSPGARSSGLKKQSP